MDYFGSQFNNKCNELESLNDLIKNIEYKKINIDYKNEYIYNYNCSKDILTLCTPICNKLIMEFDLPSKLNDEITIKLQNSLNNLTSLE
jgi:hypothetical protein